MLKIKTLNDLKKLQSSLMVLSQKAYNYHWNMKGSTFVSSHQLTQDLFEALSNYYDDVAEKIVMYDDVAIGTMKEALNLSSINEEEAKKFCISKIFKTLVLDIEIIIELTDNIEKTNVVAPLCDEIYLSMHKFRWMFKASSTCMSHCKK